MTLLLNPILEGLESARRAAPDAINSKDEVTVEDQGDRWLFEFIPDEDRWAEEHRFGSPRATSEFYVSFAHSDFMVTIIAITAITHV